VELIDKDKGPVKAVQLRGFGGGYYELVISELDGAVVRY
jgi:hypothetical protein